MVVYEGWVMVQWSDDGVGVMVVWRGRGFNCMQISVWYLELE